MRTGREETKENAFLRSALAESGVFANVEDFLDWFAAHDREVRFTVRPVPLAEMAEWQFLDHPRRLAHRSGRFFSVEGLRVETNFGPAPGWDQPIINQPEVGILGLLARKFDGVYHFLLQAKMEPGNINILQMSPTVQATFSNYTRVHQGRTPHYLEYFTEPGRGAVLLDLLQPEQGGRFLRKRNRNVIVEAAGDVPIHEDFCWLTLGQIKMLLGHDNLVNMDARTVLSLAPLADPEQPRPSEPGLAAELDAFGRDLWRSTHRDKAERHAMDEIMAWLEELNARYHMRVSSAPLDELRGWNLDAWSIRHDSGLYFSVVGMDVRAGSREAARWAQPLLHHEGLGNVGFLTQKFDGLLHFLVRGSLEPGNMRGFELGPTVACSASRERFSPPGSIPFLDLFLDPDPTWVRHRSIQSEEGGRFHHFQNNYMVLEAPEGEPVAAPPHYMWMTLGQLLRMAGLGHVNIEARNLVACLGGPPRVREDS